MTTSPDPRLPPPAIDRKKEPHGPGSAGGSGTRRTRIWDLPTRIFHWLLALATIGLIVTGRSGIMEWHFRLGYAILALLLFRLAWGFAGGRWSRFTAFVYKPRALTAYLRGHPHPDHLVGHTPLGALSVLAMLAFLGLQVVTGLMADDEIAAAGPLSHLVSGDVAGWSTAWHADRGQWVVMALIGLHILAIAYYVLIRRHRLVGPMVSGDKLLDPGVIVTPSRDDVRSRLTALILFAICSAASAWIASLRP